MACSSGHDDDDTETMDYLCKGRLLSSSGVIHEDEVEKLEEEDYEVDDDILGEKGFE